MMNLKLRIMRKCLFVVAVLLLTAVFYSCSSRTEEGKNEYIVRIDNEKVGKYVIEIYMENNVKKQHTILNISNSDFKINSEIVETYTNNKNIPDRIEAVQSISFLGEMKSMHKNWKEHEKELLSNNIETTAIEALKELKINVKNSVQIKEGFIFPDYHAKKFTNEEESDTGTIPLPDKMYSSLALMNDIISLDEENIISEYDPLENTINKYKIEVKEIKDYKGVEAINLICKDLSDDSTSMVLCEIKERSDKEILLGRMLYIEQRDGESIVSMEIVN